MTLDIIVYLSVLAGIALNGVVSFKHLTAPFKVLTSLILATLISESAARLMAIIRKNSMPTYHIFCVVQYAMVAYIYYKLLTNFRLRRLVLLSFFPFLIFSAANTLFFQEILTFPSNSIMLSFLAFILFALTLFVQLLSAPSEINIYRQSIFWFNCATLIYSIIIPISFGVLNYLIKHKLPDKLLGDTIEYFTITYYLILGYSIHLNKNEMSLSIT